MVLDLPTLAQLLIFGLTWGGLFALTANGLNLIFGVTNILNLAHGEILMLSAYIMYWLFTLLGLSPILSMVISAPLFFLLGVVIQRLVVYPLIKADPRVDKVEKASLIVFFGVLLFLQNSALLLWSADYRVVTYLNEPLKFWKVSIAANRIVVLAVALIVCLLLHLFLKSTFLGKAIRAISQDREAGMVLGINPTSMGFLSFGLGTALAGISGSLAGLIYVITPTMGFIFTIKSFIVMMIGGLGNTMGTLVAGICLGIFESLGSFYIGEGYKEAIDYFVLLLFVLLVSKGYIFKNREF
jgi:branched-chain amino acid transport system permease protein